MTPIDYITVVASLRAATDPQKRHAADMLEKLMQERTEARNLAADLAVSLHEREVYAGQIVTAARKFREAAESLNGFKCEATILHYYAVRDDLDAALAKNPTHVPANAVASTVENLSEKGAENQTTKVMDRADCEPSMAERAIAYVRGQAIMEPTTMRQRHYNEGVESAAKILEDTLLTVPTCDPAAEADRVRLWDRFAVHGGPQGEFMLYHGFREALKSLVSEPPSQDLDQARDAARWRAFSTRVYAEPQGNCGMVFFRFPVLFGGPEILKGSVVQHFAAAVDEKWLSRPNPNASHEIDSAPAAYWQCVCGAKNVPGNTACRKCTGSRTTHAIGGISTISPTKE